MAAADVNKHIGPRDGSIVEISWNLTTADPLGNAFEFIEFADRAWQAISSAWGGATLTLQGSNDGTNWFSLTNVASGSAATFTANGGASTLEVPRYGRPALTVVGAGADVDVILCARRPYPVKT